MGSDSSTPSNPSTWCNVREASLKWVDKSYKKWTFEPDGNIVKTISDETQRLSQRWMERDFYTKEVKVYTRAVQDSSQLGSGALGGLCHTFIVLETESETYILERIQEGVQFAHFDGDLSDFTATSVLLTRSKYPISSKSIGIWTQQEALREYGLGTDNCIHFVFNFGLNFGGLGSGNIYNCAEGAFVKFANKARKEVGAMLKTAST
mmetsp:Transcript_13579/g.21349  ORF Transcript_13579/g.21349 Transcript_13579/m.21349 type:complete len:207 (+) Transcript_13579:40-660(+)|eukprot:CAMPEP_0197058260 /NCGR_PEP_ID=MMETSP1384-20130603/105699_1 /TAXON_ID=29189 /ORGANISM="Ammonia sp." /LENGTH=206 /DNA_ID=CAMNT_0042492943 /DNA_START=28 /DNA_END=648 /DNA_ORIENTATION=+